MTVAERAGRLASAKIRGDLGDYYAICEAHDLGEMYMPVAWVGAVLALLREVAAVPS